VTSDLRVLVEQPTRGKRWVAVAADWPGLERGGKTEDEAVEKLARYVPRYLPVAKRARLGSELADQTELDIIGRYVGTGSTDFWGISFAPSPLGMPVFDATRGSAVRLQSAGRSAGIRASSAAPVAALYKRCSGFGDMWPSRQHANSASTPRGWRQRDHDSRSRGIAPQVDYDVQRRCHQLSRCLARQSAKSSKGLKTGDHLCRAVGVEGSKSPVVAGVERREQIDDLSPAHFADHDAVGSHA
jgi:hypothetical protein